MLVKTRPGRQCKVMRELRRRIKEGVEKNHIARRPGWHVCHAERAGKGSLIGNLEFAIL
ncbi:MAG: hypothetical protein LAN64_11835 [Acidobacteriia bacterium]|nr:hypothetical protein [Terriglobia bacterium]